MFTTGRLHAAITNPTQVRELRLENITRACLPDFSVFPNLTRLYLRKILNVNFVPFLPHLERLTLQSCPLSDQDVEIVRKIVLKNRLQHLGIHNCRISEEHVTSILQCTLENTSLEYLGLVNAPVNDAHEPLLVELVKTHPRLKFLDLDHTCVTDENHELFAAVAENLRIEAIHVSQCDFMSYELRRHYLDLMSARRMS